jgi:hypothetical protein
VIGESLVALASSEAAGPFVQMVTIFSDYYWRPHQLTVISRVSYHWTGQSVRHSEKVYIMFGSNSSYRFVLASTQELHEKITELCSRVRDLEDALRTSHAQNSNEPHPMLTDELLRVKAPLQREAPPRHQTTINQQEEENNPDVIDSFGTLAINGAGHTSYYSQFANSWVSKRQGHMICQSTNAVCFNPPVLPAGPLVTSALSSGDLHFLFLE